MKKTINLQLYKRKSLSILDRLKTERERLELQSNGYTTNYDINNRS